MGLKLLPAALCLAIAAPAAAVQGDAIASKIINDPSAPQIVGAKASVRKDDQVQGGKGFASSSRRRARTIGTPSPAALFKNT